MLVALDEGSRGDDLILAVDAERITVEVERMSDGGCRSRSPTLEVETI